MSVQKAIHYQKVMNRNLTLLGCGYWQQGENQGLKELTGGQVYFETFFVFEKGKGVSIYYDWDDPKQTPEAMVYFFFKYPEVFRAAASRFERNCLKMLQLLERPDARQFVELYDLSLELWPMIATVNVLGGLKDEKVTEGVVYESYRLRTMYDNVVYEFDAHVDDFAKAFLPTAYHPYTSVLSFAEIMQGMFPSIEELHSRQQGYMYYQGKVFTNISLAEFLKANNIIVLEEESTVSSQTEVPTISGTPGYPGTASGRVKIIYEKSQFSNIQDGDILVTPMTTPEFLPVMKRASGFITDEGGITCHAAIVAREMKKPCILGTKNATQILKDGDVVEIDANQGLVRILSHSNQL